jgi:predicted GTPase
MEHTGLGTGPRWLRPRRDPLAKAVRAAVDEGIRGAERLSVDVDRVLARLDGVAAQLRSHLDGRSTDDQQVELVVRYLERLELLHEELSELFARQRERLHEFNIALFGRTGAGKSSLVEALTRGDGVRVSPGHSDHTRTVDAIRWECCVLYDTPGIEGWGRPDADGGEAGTATNANLEREARDAAAIADLVVLVFDDQSQKEGEFDKVAAWVRDLGKPVIAVLNCKNHRWRNPAHDYSRTAAQRRGSSRTAAEHVRNIRETLERRGLGDVVIVALNAQRAVFARARRFRGPPTQVASMRALRERYGIDRLLALSNVPALEDLIVGAIERDAVSLRLGMLRDQLRSIASSMDRTFSTFEREASVIVSQLDVLLIDLLRALGPPPANEHGRSRRVTLAQRVQTLEELRGGAFDARPGGELVVRIEHLAEASFATMRAEARRGATDLVNEAMYSRKRIDPSSLLDDAALQAAARDAVDKAVQMVGDRVKVAVSDSAADLEVELERLEEIDGGAAEAGRRWGRATEIASAVASFGSMFAEPFTAIGGYVVGWVLKRRGRKRARAAEAERQRAATASRVELVKSIDKTFDDAQAKVLGRCRGIIEETRTAVLTPLVDNCIALLRFAAETRRACDELGELLRGLPAAGRPAIVLAETARELERARFPDDPRAAAKLWQGEDWIDAAGEESDDAPLRAEHPAHRQRARAERGEARERFAIAWRSRGAGLAPGTGHRWLSTTEAALAGDVAARQSLSELRELAAAPPRVVVCGDYSAGKSSLIRRLLLEEGTAPPPNLTVAGGHETSVVGAYPYDGLLLVDTPGFQSGDDELAEVAREAVQDAALVIFVFSPSLLTGSPAALDAIVRGDPGRGIVGKLDRTLFVINRCDELGVDPAESMDDYRLLCASRRRELAQVLRSRDLDVDDDDPRVIAVAGDPYGHLGDRGDVMSADFALSSWWDGIDRLRDAVVIARETLVHEGVDASVLDGGSRRVSTLLTMAREQHDALRARASTLDGLRIRINDALAGAAAHDASLPPALERAIAEELHALLRRATAEAEGDRAAIAARLEAWYADPEIALVTSSWHGRAFDAVKRWAQTTHDLIEKRIASPAFRHAHPEGCGLDVGYLKRVSHSGQESLGHPLAAVGEAFHQAGDNMMQAAWTIVDLQHGMAAVEVGSELGFGAAGIGIAESVFDRYQESKRDERRRAAMRAIEDQAHRYADLQARGDADNPGPLAVLSAMAEKLRRQLADVDLQLSALRVNSAAVADRLGLLERLVADARACRTTAAPAGA